MAKISKQCDFKGDCPKECQEVGFLMPDLKKWEEEAARVETSFGTYMIAPEDILHEKDKNPFWIFDDAQELAKQFSDEGWYLPSPAEFELIIATNALKNQRNIVLARDLTQDFGLELNGSGLRVGGCGSSSLFPIDKDEAGFYWTSLSCDKDIVGRSGYALRLKYGTANIDSVIIENTTASVRLIKRV